MLAGHSNWVTSIQVVGGTAVTGSKDWTARLWDVHSDSSSSSTSSSTFNFNFKSKANPTSTAAQCKEVLVGHTGALNSVDCVRPAPGERLRVGTCSDDGSALVWSRGREEEATGEGEGTGGRYTAVELCGVPEAHPLQHDPFEPKLLFFQKDPMVLVKQSPRMAATVGSNNFMRFFEHEAPYGQGHGQRLGTPEDGVWRPLQALDCFPDTVRWDGS